MVQQRTNEGVDIGALLAVREEVKRNRALELTTPNADLAGKESIIPGFIIPIVFEKQKVTRFFLVPSAGACIPPHRHQTKSF